MNFRPIWILLLLALCSCAAAPTRAGAGDRYTIDPDHTFSIFEYSHWGLSRQQGRFDRTSGFIEMDQDAGTGNLEIVIDAASINAGGELFNDTLRSSAFFDAARYPKITFQSSALQFVDRQLKKVDGDLTIKGITKPVVLEITQFNCRFMLIYGKRACGANATTKISRTDFNLGRYVPFVSDEVTLFIAVEAIKDE
ncbi:MAG: YceI family protein [Formivibrio sp.]|nr:YceI family protein [Formivibrio sp.]